MPDEEEGLATYEEEIM